MGLRLHSVAPAQGWRWIRQGFMLWLRRPLAFVGLFVFFLFGVLMLMVVPLVGPVLGMGTLPLLTLGFMIAARSVLQGGPVRIAQLFEGLRAVDPARRRTQLLLCAAYALGSMVVIELASWADDGLFEQLQVALATPDASKAEITRLLTDPRLAQGMVLRVGLASELSVPFWFAPALVHWGGQGARQALFSSTLALWHARGAFAVYALGWSALALAAGALAFATVLMLGSRQLVSVLSMPAGLAFSAVFYVSLWFSFADCFGVAEPDDPVDTAA
jgi:hypothetical protein